jgi:hypothetical protein
MRRTPYHISTEEVVVLWLCARATVMKNAAVAAANIKAVRGHRIGLR